jgi:hypothetical protein
MVSVNDNFTVTVNVTNAQDLDAWQVVLKYNGTGLRLNSLWVPDDSIFAGHNVCFPPVFTSFDTDAIDGSSSGVICATLFDNDYVNVSNGVICRANFAVLSAGQWSIDVADISNPLHCGGANASILSKSCWLSTTTYAEQDSLGSNCTVFAVNETVTGPEIGTITPLNSTSFLGLENFTISSISNISSLSFDPSISELSFKADVSAFDILNITLPSSIVENTSLVGTVNVDGKSYDHYYFGPSTTWSICLDQGVHVITLDIGWIDPPASPAPVPEFSLPTILLSLVMLTLFAFVLRRKRARYNSSAIATVKSH